MFRAKTSSLPNDSSRPPFNQIDSFSGILTAYFNCRYFPLYTVLFQHFWPGEVPAKYQLNALINECEGNGDLENVALVQAENAVVLVYSKEL